MVSRCTSSGPETGRCQRGWRGRRPRPGDVIPLGEKSLRVVDLEWTPDHEEADGTLTVEVAWSTSPVEQLQSAEQFAPERVAEQCADVHAVGLRDVSDVPMRDDAADDVGAERF